MNDMTPTDKLRALLDERGIEHDDNDANTEVTGVRITRWKNGGKRDVRYEEWRNGTTRLDAGNVSPEQAVAATVGLMLDQDLQQALDFMRIWITDDAHLGESAISYELEKAEGLRKLEAIEQAIAATVCGYGITFAPTLDRPPETMVGETVFDAEGNAIGWITSATVGVGTCQRERFDADPDGIFVGETVIDDEGNEMPIAEIFGYRCSECKGLLELEWVACPHCGKRIIEEEK